jgi:hypothetical protein
MKHLLDWIAASSFRTAFTVALFVCIASFLWLSISDEWHRGQVLTFVCTSQNGVYVCRQVAEVRK